MINKIAFGISSDEIAVLAQKPSYNTGSIPAANVAQTPQDSFTQQAGTASDKKHTALKVIGGIAAIGCALAAARKWMPGVKTVNLAEGGFGKAEGFMKKTQYAFAKACDICLAPFRYIKNISTKKETNAVANDAAKKADNAVLKAE